MLSLILIKVNLITKGTTSGCKFVSSVLLKILNHSMDLLRSQLLYIFGAEDILYFIMRLKTAKI